jgi:hypothetical protein
MVALSSVVTVVILVIVVWCAIAALLAFAVGAFLRRVSGDRPTAGRLREDRRGEARKTA